METETATVVEAETRSLRAVHDVGRSLEESGEEDLLAESGAEDLLAESGADDLESPVPLLVESAEPVLEILESAPVAVESEAESHAEMRMPEGRSLRTVLVLLLAESDSESAVEDLETAVPIFLESPVPLADVGAVAGAVHDVGRSLEDDVLLLVESGAEDLESPVPLLLESADPVLEILESAPVAVESEAETRTVLDVDQSLEDAGAEDLESPFPLAARDIGAVAGAVHDLGRPLEDDDVPL